MPQEYEYLAIVDERAPTSGGYEYVLTSPSSPVRLDSARPWQLATAPERYLALGSYDSQDPIVEEIPVLIEAPTQALADFHKAKIANMLQFLATRYAKGMQQTPIKLKARAKGSTTTYEMLILGQISDDDQVTVIDPDYGYPVSTNRYTIPNVTLRFRRRGPMVAPPVDYPLTNLVFAPNVQYVTLPNVDITSPYMLRVGSFEADTGLPGNYRSTLPDMTLIATRGRDYLHKMTFVLAEGGGWIKQADSPARTADQAQQLFTSSATATSSKVLVTLASDVRRVKVFVVGRATVANDVWSITAKFYGIASTGSTSAAYPNFTTIGAQDYVATTTNPRVIYAGTGGFLDTSPKAMQITATRISGTGGFYLDQVFVVAADNDTTTIVQTLGQPYTLAFGQGAPSQIGYFFVRYDPRNDFRPLIRIENNVTATSTIVLSYLGLPVLRTVGTEIAFTLLGPGTAYVLTTSESQTGAAMQLDGIVTRYTRSLFPQ